jgi:hypothetical protein
MRVLFALVALLLLGTFAPVALFKGPVFPEQARLWFDPVPLDESNRARTRLGPLVYLGGWAMRSNDPRYGGISAIHVEGGELLALSDAGILFRHKLPGGRQGLPIQGHMLHRTENKKNRDTESLIVHGGKLWAVFERHNGIRRYERATLKQEAFAMPAEMRHWGRNSGGEASLRLPDGRFLVVSERSRLGENLSEAVLLDGDPTAPHVKARRFIIQRPAGYRITDVARLPDGRLFFLHRRFSYLTGVSAKLSALDEVELAKAKRVSLTELVHFEPPLTVENLEGLSVTREQGRTILWIASDDNFNGFQRTLLLKFALAEPKNQKRPRRET